MNKNKNDKDDLILRVNGIDYHGWQSVQVTRSLQAIAGQFQVDYSKSESKAVYLLSLHPGDACTVLLGDTPVITGYIDTLSSHLEGQSKGAQCTGRDKTADLVDASSTHHPDEFRGLDLAGIARLLTAPFGITVKTQVPVGAPFSVFKLQPGETVFEAIERAARMRGILLISDGLGNLVLTQTGQERAHTPLIQGNNVLSISGQFNHQERFSHYIVKGQQQGWEELTSEQSAEVKAQAQDTTVLRHRPLMIFAETVVDQPTAQQRANWEATVRAARSTVISVVVQGWRQQDDSLWAINQRVQVELPTLGIDDEWLITQVTYSLNMSQGTTTALELMRPDAFVPQPVVVKENNTSTGWKELIDAR